MLVVSASLGLLLSTIWIVRDDWLPTIGLALNVSDPLRHAPIVLILPGSEETRPFVAAGLMRAGYADLALIPETRNNPGVLGGMELSTAETTRQILLRRGIPGEKIMTLIGSSDSTIGDATALNRYFEQSGATDVIIVTSAYHSRRARWTFRHVLPEHQARLRFYSAPNGYDDRMWWVSRKGRRAVLSEWLKFAFYVTYHGDGWLWCVVSTLVGGGLVLIRRRSLAKGSNHVGVRTADRPDCGT